MDARVLKSEVRQRLARAIRDAPGATITDLSRSVALSHSTVSYHLRILERAGEIQSKRDGRTVRYYARGDYDDLKTRLRPLLERPRVREILRLVQQRPELVPFNIARELRVSVPTVMWHLGKLRDYGVLHMEKRNGHYDIILTPAMRGLLENGEAPANAPVPGGNEPAKGGETAS